MNMSKSFRCVVLATACFIAMAQGAAEKNPYEEKGTYWTPLFEALKKADFNENSTYTYSKPTITLLSDYKKYGSTFPNNFNTTFPTDFAESPQEAITAFFEQLMTDKLQPLNRALVGTEIRTDLTWQQIENIVKILNHSETVQAIINKIGLTLSLQNDTIQSLKTEQKYRVKLFLKSLKTIFEKNLKKEDSKKKSDYVSATLFEDLLNDADHSTQLVAEAKQAMTAATTKRVEKKRESKIAEAYQKEKIDAFLAKKESPEIKAQNDQLADLQKKVVAGEKAVEQAKAKLLAAKEAAKIPPALPADPLEQLQHGLMALKTKLAQLAQALNHLQNPTVPRELSNIENKKVKEAKEQLAQAKIDLQTAQQALVSAQQAAQDYQNKDNPFTQLHELEQIAKDALAPALATLEQYTNAHQIFNEAHKHYLATLRSVEISVQTDQEKLKEKTEDISESAEKNVEQIKLLSSQANIRNPNTEDKWKETKAIEERLNQAQTKLAELKDNNTDLAQKEALAKVIKQLLEEIKPLLEQVKEKEQRVLQLALRVDNAEKNGRQELVNLLIKHYPDSIPVQITIKRTNALSMLNSPKEETRKKGCEIIEKMIQDYKK